MYQSKKVLHNFKSQFPEKDVKRDFFKIDTTQQQTVLTPFQIQEHLTPGVQGFYKEQLQYEEN